MVTSYTEDQKEELDPSLAVKHERLEHFDEQWPAKVINKRRSQIHSLAWTSTDIC
jgi:hypothetical protein